MPTIHKRVETRRGCGYRQPGGLYLVGPTHGTWCHKLPIELTVCPVCHSGIKPGRGFQWVDSMLFTDAPCNQPDGKECPRCDLAVTGRMGLMWVGEKFYPSAAHFAQEAARMGVSKRLPAVPLEFEPGKTWVALAHRQAIVDYSDGPTGWVDSFGEAHTTIKYKPGIFMLFKPSAVEYIVKGNETDEQLQRLEDRGITLVQVTRDEDLQQDAFDDIDADMETPDPVDLENLMNDFEAQGGQDYE